MKKVFTFWLMLIALASHVSALAYADAVLEMIAAPRPFPIRWAVDLVCGFVLLLGS